MVKLILYVKKMKTKIFITVLLSCFAAIQLKAQDFHLAQYDAAPVYLNPALTGNYLGEDGDYRIGIVNRSQWRSMGAKPYNTYGISYDQNLQKKFGVGGYLMNNKSGAGSFNTLDFQLSGSYLITDPKTSPHLLSTGLQMGLFYKSINPDNLLFESQYDNSSGTLNPDINSGEYSQKTNRLNFDANMGVFYKYRDVEKKYWPFIGLSLAHINLPSENFGGQKSRLPIRMNINTGCDFKIDEKFRITPMILFMRQAKATEFNIGSLVYYKINDSKDVKYEVIGGLTYRLKDALTIQGGIKKDNIVLRMSYDITTTYLGNYNNRRGGFELTLSIIGKKGDKLIKGLARF